MISFRKISIEDAEHFLKLQRTLDLETSYMLLKPEERRSEVSEVIQSILESIHSNSFFIVAVNENEELVGYLSAQRGIYKKINHTAYIVVGILQKYQGKGIGKQFFSQLNAWTEEEKVIRLELTVMSTNLRAINLYEKQGFQKEGIRKKSIYQNGTFIDEYYMAKLF